MKGRRPNMRRRPLPPADRAQRAYDETQAHGRRLAAEDAAAEMKRREDFVRQWEAEMLAEEATDFEATDFEAAEDAVAAFAGRLSLTALKDIVSRARIVIETADDADEHSELLGELRAVERLCAAAEEAK